jgi:hypothetical protein
MAFSYICQKAKTIVVLVVCCSPQPKLRWLPHMDIGNPTFRAPFGARQVHTEDNIPKFGLLPCLTPARSDCRHRRLDVLQPQAPITRAVTAPIPHPSPDLEDDFDEIMLESVGPHKQPKWLTASAGSTSVAGLCLIHRSGLQVAGRHAADTKRRTSQC